MKILRIYTKLPPLKGGMEKHIYNLSQMQLKAGHFVQLFFNDGEKLSLHDKKISKLKLHKTKPQFLGMLIFYLAIIKELIFQKQKFDIVHIHGDWSSLLFFKIIKRLTKAKIVCFSIHDKLSASFTHQKLLPKLVQDIDLIFSTGYDTAQELERLSKKKVIVQPSGISELFFEEFKKDFNNSIFTLVTVANLFPKKNIELILEIAKELKDCRFIIVGDGIHRKFLEDKIKDENILNVELVGFKTPKEVRDYYLESDCYLLTSFAEGTPTSALEALSCGLVIVSSNAGGLGNIVKEEENGFIIDSFDKNIFIEKIRLLKNDKSLREKIFEKNKALAKEFNWDKVTKNITSNMKRVLNEKN